ncbi:MAG TPA: hypothetical protein VFZ25_15430, partial [Chloroflexota bacterium]|nr:hypothetical protein [Chloroflexota bacterium]
ATTTAELLNNQLQAAQATIASLQGSANPAGSSNAVALQQALANYQTLLQKRSDALLASQDAAHVSYIQIVNSAPEPSATSWLKAFGIEAGLTVVGSVGIAILAILVLESLYPARRIGNAPSAGSPEADELSATPGHHDLTRLPLPHENYRGNSLRSRESH